MAASIERISLDRAGPWLVGGLEPRPSAFSPSYGPARMAGPAHDRRKPSLHRTPRDPAGALTQEIRFRGRVTRIRRRPIHAAMLSDGGEPQLSEPRPGRSF